MGDSKQVKVDNWGIFFLQRLQSFFNKTFFCDLTLQFEDNVQLKVHRLVMNTCTEYFQVLEQTCEVINDCLIMPPDLQADVVVPIVNFMYTGILEYQTSIFDRLYTTARLMNMTVLTKLLDAQKVPILPIPKSLNKRTPVAPITWNLQGKKIAPKTMDPDLPEPLPGRKLPIWKRKSVSNTIPTYRNDIVTGIPDPLTTKYFRSSAEELPRPTRFEWPEDDDASFDTNSFDEISYTSKPIVIPQREKSPKPSTSSNNFEELKRTSVAVKRSGSPVYNESKKVNIQDVKEYIKEQKLRSDYIDYDDSEAADNDLQTYENDNDSDDENKDDIFDQNNEDAPNKSILKNDTSTSHNKRVRFSLEGKENAANKTPQKPATTAATVKTNSPSVDVTNHTKIITEVLKKYPHLVKKNKNIKLKILAKGANVSSAGLKPIGTPMKVVKPATKVSYMVKKPNEASKPGSVDIKKDGHWSCHRCSNPNPLIFETYYLYRKHLTEIHNEKTDSQMCNICGHISRKQNMLIYHKLIKHNVQPPASYQFPKCKDCSYIALSQAMLVKHQINHTHQNNVCAECNTSFTTKSALISHVQLTGHTGKNNCPTFDCTYCTKKFISDETLFQHIRNNHKEEARRDNIISPVEEDDSDLKENIITSEEIDSLEENSPQEVNSTQIEPVVEKTKEKIKILSDVKVSSAKHPVKIINTEPPTETTSTADAQSLEPSSEAESLSNVASGIAASLGLVNTIVVLDDNQFILQSQDGNQENIIANPQNIILPDVTNINNIQNLVSQHQVITTDTNTIITQAALNKSNIASTDELVMVLTDHDYSDATNNTVITSENSNIVVLYSHPVQSQDGQFISQSSNLMINSDMGIVEVGNNYTVANTVPMDDKQCEESIELIQQEINNHLENETHEIPPQTEKIEQEQVIGYEEVKTDVVQEVEEDTKEVLSDESEKMEIDPVEENTEQTQNVELVEPSNNPEIPVPSQVEVVTESNNSIPVSKEDNQPSNTGDNHYEEPMEIEESIEMIQQEIHRSSTQVQETPPQEEQETTSEDIAPSNTEEIVEENKVEEVENEKKEVEPVKEIVQTETEEQIQQVVVAESETEICEERKEVEEETECHEEEVEHMEVDSSKLVKNENIEIQNVDSEIKINDTKDEESELPLNNAEDSKPETIVSNTPEEKSECVEEVVSEEETPEQQIELSSEEESVKEISQEETIEHQQQEPVVTNEENQKHNKEDNTLIVVEKLPDSIEKEISELMGENSDELKPENAQEPQNIQEIIETEVVEEQKDHSENSTPEESQDSDESQEKEKPSEEILIIPEESNEVKVVTTEEIPIKNTKIRNPKISNLLDDWDDGDTDSQQSDTPKPTPVTEESRRVVNTLINDWEDEEET